ncbi:hypothetical protein Tco_0674431 [Tanacetum coccineum]
MASKHNSSGPALHEMTPTTISSGLMPNSPPSTPFVPPSRTDWGLLFQPLFDELLTLPPSVDYLALKVIALIPKVVAPKPAASTSSPSSITIDQDAPSPFEPKNYKDALTQVCWIEAMQEELNEFERLKVWELIPRPDKVMVITLNGIYKVKLDELGGDSGIQRILLFIALDILFQQLFDEYFNPTPCVVSPMLPAAAPLPTDTTATPSSTIID